MEVLWFQMDEDFVERRGFSDNFLTFQNLQEGDNC